MTHLTRRPNGLTPTDFISAVERLVCDQNDFVDCTAGDRWLLHSAVLRFEAPQFSKGRSNGIRKVSGVNHRAVISVMAPLAATQ